jgi:Animal haem peroxidase
MVQQTTTRTQPVPHGGNPVRGLDTAPASSSKQGRFGRMFRNLPVYEVPDDALTALGEAMAPEPDPNDFDKPLGKPDDDENVSTIQNVTDAGKDELRLPAGYTYFGQFVDHDITFDPVSSLMRQNDPDALVDFRTPRFDLDSLYGRGPSDEPYLYDADGLHLLFQPGEFSGGFPDQLRNPNGRAIIGDPRNDENLIVSQLQVAMIRFHNAVVDRVRESLPHESRDNTLKIAQQRVRWHYQWVVVHDFLPRLVGEDIVDDILQTTPVMVDGGPVDVPTPRLRFYHPTNEAYMPVEFSVAAYRFGHSMVRPSYNINAIAKANPARQGVNRIPIFVADADPGPLADLRGFRRLPGFWAVDWRFFLDGVTGPDPQPENVPQPSYKIDAELASPLRSLPADVTGDDPFLPQGPPAMRSLAVRNLLRGKRLGLPAGEDVARAMGITPIAHDDLFDAPPWSELDQKHRDALREHTPLWFYVLRESQLLTGSSHLGPVGGRIVAEVLIGILERDPLSFLRVFPGWQPDLTKAGTEFQLRDIINVASETDATTPTTAPLEK